MVKCSCCFEEEILAVSLFAALIVAVATFYLLVFIYGLIFGYVRFRGFSVSCEGLVGAVCISAGCSPLSADPVENEVCYGAPSRAPLQVVLVELSSARSREIIQTFFFISLLGGWSCRWKSLLQRNKQVFGMILYFIFLNFTSDYSSGTRNIFFSNGNVIFPVYDVEFVSFICVFDL